MNVTRFPEEVKFISGFELSSKFIAAEEPIANTMGNFWTMIWEQNTRVIVMLNGSKEQLRTSYPYLSSSQVDTISFHTFHSRKYISRNRFLIILRMLYFNYENTRAHTYDKVDPLIEYFNNTMKGFVHPERELTIDESIVLFREPARHSSVYQK
ncbi:unnamed protein product [Spodoptera littoralis]|uniref:Tyrosine-protein phosphatase domain-containing protein n=1 Tax=Spodoptera littoralis TaxID=7109 RepID=A0A9P0HUY8_SPOLI|nr:unnamed protein product [Spodoptera littoralis]CAH1634708.1 unnamed protein product [Spodoptera littoralis]